MLAGKNCRVTDCTTEIRTGLGMEVGRDGRRAVRELDKEKPACDDAVNQNERVRPFAIQPSAAVPHSWLFQWRCASSAIHEALRIKQLLTETHSTLPRADSR